MKDEEIVRLIHAFDEQQRVIEAQGEIIDELYALLSQHISAEEALPLITRINTILSDTG